MAEDWEEPGRQLLAAREAKGMTIADVSHRTRIPTKVIEALEKDDYGSFPSPTYAKSFLAQYADFVGIDSSRWMDFFEPVAFTGPDDVLSIVDAPDPGHHHAHHHASVAELRHPRSGRGVGSTVMLILLTGGLVYGFVQGWPVIEKTFSGTEIDSPPPAQPPRKYVQEYPTKELPPEAPKSQEPAKLPEPAGKHSETAQKEPIAPRAIIVGERLE
ncbi:MAG: helix-turn-helix domain-containing protein [Luteolibacter sp.]